LNAPRRDTAIGPSAVHGSPIGTRPATVGGIDGCQR
jgi:hypothetical protein